MSGKRKEVRQNGFNKRERIVSQKLIDRLFSKSGSHSVVAAFPVRAVYNINARAREDDPAVVLLVSVPKRQFHHAVDRNRVKRQLREAFRLNKQLIADAVPADRQMALALVWLTDRHLSSAEVNQRLVNIMKRIASHLPNTNY